MLPCGAGIKSGELIGCQTKGDHLGWLRSAAGPPTSSPLEGVNVITDFSLRRPRRDLLLGNRDTVDRLFATHAIIVLRNATGVYNSMRRPHGIII